MNGGVAESMVEEKSGIPLGRPNPQSIFDFGFSLWSLPGVDRSAASFSFSFPNLYPGGIGAPSMGLEILTFSVWSTLGVWISGGGDIPSRDAS